MKPIEQPWVACDAGAASSFEPASAPLIEGEGVDQAELVVEGPLG